MWYTATAGTHSTVHTYVDVYIVCVIVNITSLPTTIAASRSFLWKSQLLLLHLQDSPLTNAGIGSCLNLAGQVECDAGIMEGQSGTFGAVGAVAGIKNPSMAALRVMEEGKQGQLFLGRIPPMCVCLHGSVGGCGRACIV